MPSSDAVLLALTTSIFACGAALLSHRFYVVYHGWSLGEFGYKPHLPGIRVPTLLVNARDDPFLPEEALPTEREVSSAVKLEFPARGGHVGFVTRPFPGQIHWLPRRLLHFFEHAE